MSILKIRAALEVGLNSITPALPTAWQNMDFTPPASGGYQRVALLPAQPENPSIGASLHREVGILQVTLIYPQNAGPSAAEARAEAIRAQFRRGSSWIKDGVTVIVDGTPAIAAGRNEDGRFVVPVSIPYHANVFS
ncbi:phage tail terminator-like protein [Caldimonas sp. KR1-144]|uniref:phage tail terminator-like protein n=1 Tax=Caldimonas sp. KR1-144 TaxID=3400911 RepID=UPI003BFDB0DB